MSAKFRHSHALALILVIGGSLAGWATPASAGVSPSASYFTVDPCRVFDTRPGNLPSGTAMPIQFKGVCNVPTEASAAAISITAVNPTNIGFLTFYPTGSPAPEVSYLNFNSGQTRSGSVIVLLSAAGSVDVLPFVSGSGNVELVVDVFGYFANLPPVAVNDTYAAERDTTLNVGAATGVTSNDTLNGGSIASYGATTGGEQTTIGAATPTSAGGSIALNANGSFSYTPPSGAVNIDDTFKYVLQNPSGNSMATVTVGVGKTNQTISFTSTSPSDAKVAGPTYTVTATATSGLPVAFTIDATAASVCSIVGSTVSFIGAGTCVINANQPGDSNFNPAPQVQQSFPVGKGDQTIAFTSTAPSDAKVGGPTYDVTATATSGLAVTFSIDASASSVCSIAGSTVSFLTVGTCVINANQAGDANWNPAPQVQQSFAVAKGDQTITFTSTAPSDATVNGPTYNVTATASSLLLVTLTIDASATSVCSIAGSTVSFTAAGTCVINADQAGDANYNPAPQAQQSFAVSLASQTISFTSTAPADAKVGGPTYNVTATATSGLTVTLTIDASASTVCTIAGSTVSFIGAGTCVINANQAGDASFAPAPQEQQSFAVTKNDQTITFTSTAPTDARVSGPAYSVTATATSGLTVTFTIDASASTVCTIAGSTVSFIGAGTCVINADQVGDTTWNPAPQVQQTFPVAKGDQTITFTSTAPVGATVAGPTYAVTATATSSLAVIFTIDAAASTVCTIAGSTVSFIGAGTCVINANQPGDANWNPAPQVQQSFLVVKQDQTITFTSTAPVGATVAGPTYTVTATATSGLAVTFTIEASAASVCTIAGSTVSFIGAGTCVINANQAGNGTYNPAPQVQQSFPVVKQDQTITFTSTAPVGATVAGPTYTVTATATSGLAVTFTIDASAASVCTIAGSTVSFIGAGTCVINANQAGDATYNPAPQVQQSFPVVKQNQTITFTSTAPVGATVAGPTYTVTATATSGLAVTFTIDPSASSVCMISGSTVSFIGAGTCVINANQAGDGTYNPAPQVQQSFLVVKQDQTITFTSTPPALATIGGPTYTVTATATSGLAVTFAIDPSAASVCTIAGSTVSFIGGGTCVINANQAGNGTYNPAPQVQQSFNVNFPPTPIASPKENLDTIGNTAFEFKAAQSLSPSVFVLGRLKDNFTDGDGPSPLSVIAIVAGPTVNGAKVDVDTNGEFTYTPKAGDTMASDSFSYQITDGAYTINRTVTINLKGRVWYVKNDDPLAAPPSDDGTSVDPFDTLAAAQAASSANDYIFVYFGDGTTTGQNAGIVLKNGQHLIGEFAGLSVTFSPAITFNGVPGTTSVPLLVPPSATFCSGNPCRPMLDDTVVGVPEGVGATDVIPVEIVGLNLAGNVNAIDWTTTGAFGGTGTLTIKDNVVRSATNEGVDINLAGTAGVNLAFQDNNLTSTGTALDIQETGTGSLTVTAFHDNIVTGSSAGAGILVNTALFDATPGGAIQPVAGGATVIGTPGDRIGGPGLTLSNVTGALNFANAAAGTISAGDLDIFSDSGAALSAAGGAGGFDFDITPNTGILVANAGPAAVLATLDADVQLNSLTSSNSASNGVSLTSVTGTFSAPGGSSITNAGTTDFAISGANANVTYGGTIADDAGQLVSVASTTGGTKSFTGAISDGPTANTGSGISLTSNTGATISFSGGLALSTGSNPAFTATGGGTVAVTGATNTLATLTGTALNVANTTIGASGLTFRSISANGAASGIVLNNTGVTVGLTVTGTGGAGTGGTIQNTTSDGVSLTATRSPSFTNLTIQNTAGSGVKGTTVTNFSFVNGSIDNSGTALGAEAANIAFNTTAAGTENNLSGVVTITGNALTNAYYHGVDIFNFNGTISDVSISNNTITSSSSTVTSKGSGIRLVGFGSATTVANVTKATIANNIISNFPSANGILASGGNGNAAGPAGVFGTAGSGTDIIAITGNRVAGFSAAVKMGAFGIAATVNGKGQGNFNVSSNGTVANPITNVIGAAITNSSLGFANVTSTISNNVIVANNQAGAQGIGAGTSQTFSSADTPSLTVTITSNQVSQTDGNGILVTARDATGVLRAKIQGNNVAAPLAGNRNGIRVDAGNAVSVNDSVCLNISGNTTAGVGLSPEGIGLRKQGTVAATNNFALHGFATSPANQAQTAAYSTAQNPGSASGTLIISGDNFNSPTCSFP